ncbi:MAG: hypothetical protein H0U36_11600, partial [Nocardioidaceae bacterium]|nr:hypothetical protein [Nocardioidaceae bacterium]
MSSAGQVAQPEAVPDRAGLAPPVDPEGPALLADRNADLDTMLHLTGLGQLAKCSPHEVKTISAHEACLRCARIVPEFTYTHQA